MKYVIISDIHEDYDALSTIMKRVKEMNIDKIFCLGDIIGFNSKYNSYKDSKSANKCIQILIKNKVEATMGNHEYNFLNIFFFQNYINDKNKYSYDDEPINLNESNLKFIKFLRERIYEENMTFSHFLFPNNIGKFKVTDNHLKLVESHFKNMFNERKKISFVGHLHSEKLQIITPKKIYIIEEKQVYRLNDNEFYIINCPPIVRSKKNLSAFTHYDSFRKTIFWEYVKLP